MAPSKQDDPRQDSGLVRHFDTTFLQIGRHLPEPEKEVPFLEDRGFHFDRAWSEYRVAVEIEGGVHKIDNRFQSDIEKYNLAQLEGWLVIRFSSEWLTNQPYRVFAWIEEALVKRGWRRE